MLTMVPTRADGDPESDRPNQNEGSVLLKNMSQFLSMFAGLLLLTASGIEIGFTLFGITFDTQKWTENATKAEVILIHCMFFVGSIVGGFNAGFFVDSMGRRNTMKLSYGALVINGVLLILVPRTVIWILIARLCSGYSWGLLYVVLTIMAGEISLKRYRGLFTSLVYFFSFTGAFIFALINMFHRFEDVNFISGWITIGLLLISIPCFYFFTVETPHYHCMKNNDNEGLQNLLYLRRERVITLARKEEFLQIQQAVARDMQHQAEGSVFKNRLFYVLLIIRIPVVFASNQLLNRSQLSIVTRGIYPQSMYLFQPLLLTAVHLIASLIAMISLDRFRRIYFYTIPILLSAIMLVISGIVLATYTFNPFLFIILFEIFTGLGITMTGDVLMTEAFSMRKKGIAISWHNSFLMLQHLIFILVTFTTEVDQPTNYTIFFVHGAVLLVCGVLRISETKRLTLLEARQNISIQYFKAKL